MGPHSLVTGAAGFIGSHLAEALLEDGHTVIGVDSFNPYYGRARKTENIAKLQRSSAFQLREMDLRVADIEPLLAGVDYVFHQAGQPGVLASWGTRFTEYTANNVVVTQRLLEAARGAGIQRFVQASSSSIYGNAKRLPADEETLPRPVSPYGVTKLAADNLCTLYATAFQVPTVCLRYFTVYGPRQRPDMAFDKFLKAISRGEPVTVNGDGRQTRDFTFVSDIVAANLAAATRPGIGPGAVYNLGGGHRVSMMDVIGTMEELVGTSATVTHSEPQPGDARDTHADCTRAAADLGWQPRYGLEDGLRAQLSWLREAGEL
jgi:nucleoside-diphosphate-sugar epimerase